MSKIISKLTIYTLILSLAACDFSDNEISKWSSIFSEPSTIVSSFDSGTYKNESLRLEFSFKNAHRLIVFYNGDSVSVYNDTVGLIIGNKKNTISFIPTAGENNTNYKHSWLAPKKGLSSFHKVQVYSYDIEGRLLASLTQRFVLGAQRKDFLPVVNLQVDNQYLFSADSGCYVPGNSFKTDDEYNSGNYYLFKKRKQLSWIEIFDTANLYLSDSLLFRIHGLITPVAPQKSLRFYLDTINLKLPQLLGLDHSLDKFILRSSYSGWDTELFVDGWISDICKNLNLDVMAYRPVKVFLNNEYWGVHGLRERMDLNAISAKHQLKLKKIIDGDDKGYSNKTNSFGDLNELLKLVKADSAVDYKKIKKAFKMKSLTDWLIVELFFQNTDWPCNNTFFWKKTKKSGEWRAVLIDMDAAVGNPNMNMFEFATKDRSPLLGGVLATYLLNHPAFQASFRERVVYLFENDLSKKVLKEKLASYKLLFDPVIQEHYRRWNPDHGLKDYKRALKRLDKFCENRHESFIQNMNAYFQGN